MNDHVKNIMLVAGEASGDQRGAEVAQALLSRNPQLTLFGIGGTQMRTAGVKTTVDVNQLAVIGFFEIIKHLPRILKIFNNTKQLLKERQPDLLILIDYPGFNLRLAKIAKTLNIPVLFYISPQVWAWRAHRVKKIAQLVDHMAVIFPFEKQYYQQQNLAVTYVGHPLTEKLKQIPSINTARSILSLKTTDKVVTLLPGSRTSEIERLLPIMLDAVSKLATQHPELKFLLAKAATIDIKKINTLFGSSTATIQIINNDTYTAISAADVVLTASGTATLETALLNKPMVVIYRMNRLTAAMLKRLLKIPYVSLCNIVAGKQVVVELLQKEANSENINKEILLILNDQDYCKQMKSNLKLIKEKLGDFDAAVNVAQIALQMLSSTNG